jgi:glycerol-3-phosphate dehydrogenase
MAEQTVDAVVDFTKASSKACTTATTPLLPGEPQPAYSGILPPPVSREAVEHYCRNEWAVHLYDVMIRRTSWRYYHRDHLAIAEQAARWMAQTLGWDDDRVRQELLEYDRAVAESSACGFATPVRARGDHHDAPAQQQQQQQQQVQPA